MYLTIDEIERVAYIRNDQATLRIMAQVEEETIEAQALLFEDQIEDLKSDSLSRWEKNNGPVKEYYDFFYECFQWLNDGVYPCPSVTSDYDKSIIFNAIRGTE